MQWTDIARDWAAFTPAIQDRWPEAEEEDLLALNPTEDALAGYLSQQTGEEFRDVKAQVREWQMGQIPTDVAMDPLRDNANISDSHRHLAPGEDPSDRDDLFGDDDQAENPVGRDV
ncbi:hypothetical protein [Pseudooceanicola sp. MF1-13]|uniref:hypothetical protein n=1 Tax=Pseudooceanicola sp. MF1-13 TaxID=3379095 RepID=UPI0038914171